MSFKHLSFIDLFTKEDLLVEIPMLQRDYVYGRKTESEKRKEFLKNIKGYLLSENKNHELDFVYGSVSSQKGEKVLTLIDGQQRITTLFLLHWYFAITNEEYINFRSLLWNNDKSKFTYNTRESSTSFCNALVFLNKKRISDGKEEYYPQEKDYYKYISLNNETLLSDQIKNEKWFYSHWNNDPTVVNMLNMLDDIAKTFPFSECKGLYKKLNQTGSESSITFNILPLDEFKLTDELYIKMNSRGKPLTRFENLKSKILKEYDKSKETEKDKYKEKLDKINKQEDKKYGAIRDYVGLMMDTRWTDMFWNFWLDTKEDDKPLVDDMFLSFICNICIVFEVIRLMDKYLSMQRNTPEEQIIEELMDARNNVSYERIIEILKANDNYLLYSLIDILNLISEKDEKGKWVLRTYFDNKVYYFNEKDTFESIVYDYNAKDRNYELKVIYFAYISYLLKYKPSKQDSRFEDWMRFVYDMCKNSYGLSNGVYTFSNCLAGINYLLSSEDIYDTLSTKQLNDLNDIVTLDKYQLEEELLKAKLFKNKNWKNAINNALSKLKYFEGQINFELIYDTKVKSTDVNDEDKIKEFTSCVCKVASIFDKKDGCTFDSELVRALLSKGDYTTSYKSSQSLFQNGTDRDISWRRYHKAEKIEYNSDKRCFLAQVITDSDFDYKKPEESLRKIADKHSVEISEWQKILIDNLKDFEKIIYQNDNHYYFGEKRLLRWNTASKHKNDNKNKDNWEIDLISKQQITSKHAELFTYSIYCNNKNEKISPFSNEPRYILSDSQDFQPRMVYGELEFANEHYYLQLLYNDFGLYELRFMNWNENKGIIEDLNNSEIIKIIQSNAFSKDEKQNYYVKTITHDEIMPNIKKLCNSLDAII